MDSIVTIAISKGRILQETLPLLASADIVPEVDPDSSRKLILGSNQGHIKLVILRAADVPTYVQYGAADLGITGKDVLLEHGGEGLYEPLDLGIARCRLMVAGPTTPGSNSARLRVATKYTNITRCYFAKQGRQVELIKLYGSMELAPLVGLADRIVDVVDTGSTLRANGLVALEHIADISSRLVVNRATMKTKYRPVRELIDAIARSVAQRK